MHPVAFSLSRWVGWPGEVLDAIRVFYIRPFEQCPFFVSIVLACREPPL